MAGGAAAGIGGVLVSALSMLCQLVKPTGRHRSRPVPAPRPALMRPAEALANDLGWCPAEQEMTLHAYLTLGGRQCWTCRTVTSHHPLTSTPAKGGAS